MFDRIAIIGLGLIGGSVARAVHARRLAAAVVGCDSNEISLAYGKKHGFIDMAASDPQAAVKDASLVILATPPSSLADIAEAIAPALAQNAIVMDTCSVKQSAIAAVTPHLPPGVEFIPAHPIAGSEESGIAAGRADLFAGKHVVLTPEQPTMTNALRAAADFWHAMEGRIEIMPPHVHDLMYAYVSHLPHLLAFAAAASVEADENETLRRFLRLSRSNPRLWADIAIRNRANTIKALDRYLDAVAHVRNELQSPPDAKSDAEDTRLAHTVLFPRIAASCLVTTVMETERQAGFPFARYAGTGFTDFTSPAATPPDEDLERISGQYPTVCVALDAYLAALKPMRDALAADDPAALEAALNIEG